MEAPDTPPTLNDTTLAYILQHLNAEELQYSYLNGATQSYFRQSTSTVVYMSICLSCTLWQLATAAELVYKVRKWLHFAVLFETVLSFVSILISILNPVTSVTCDFRFWVSIICVNLGGCCIQSILLYKAYICYDQSKWLLALGSFINLGYIALTFVYATLGKVPTYKDILGNCVMKNLEWPALAKLGLDIASNVFLSIAFLMVIHRHYRVFGNSLHKSLLSGGILFSVGVIASNICTAILVSCRVMGGLSADLYSFDWVITSYLLIKQVKSTKKAEQTGKEDKEEEEEEEEDDDVFDDSASKTTRTIISSTFDMAAPQSATASYGLHIMQPITTISSSATAMPATEYCLRQSSLASSFAATNYRTSSGVVSNTTTVQDTPIFCENCSSYLTPSSLLYKSSSSAVIPVVKYNQDEEADIAYKQ